MENKITQGKYETFSPQNILILTMLLFFSFTSLRFGAFGVGELLLLFFCILQLAGQKTILVSFHHHFFSLFWVFFLCFMTFGYGVNTFLEIAPRHVTFDYKAYVVILFLCFTFETLFKKSNFKSLYSLLRFLYFGGLVVIGALYLIYLSGTRVLFGFYLTYAGSHIFSPFANDYHQFAYFVAPLPFIGLYLMVNEKRLSLKVLAIVGIILSVLIGLSTTSSTLVSAWAISTLAFCIFGAGKIISKLNMSISIMFALICLIIVIALFNYETILGMVQDFFHGDSNGENRLVIWSNAIKSWLYSPIFGLGPGSYAGSYVFGGFEAHNTFLQILTQSGIAGGLAYILMVTKLTKNTYVNTFILCSIISLIAYGLGINDLRRTVLWFYYILFYYLVLKSKGEY
ncbi:O-antigen ligase family protein [Neobacillus sp. YIM B06451]|uniref:O-antigen ligase family protein n=1 Tax=Neobacillus sp. YIM B06451 TaxID=3070994 RepID=UPI00292FF04C|nr:O-antigen ligase family protein [Neobacillus sp. YIM B06451]